MTDCFPRKVAQYVGLVFQTPPFSTNAIWRAFRGRNIKSKEYRDWQKASGAELESQAPACVPGTIAIYIQLTKKCRLDVDNPIKAYLDLLTTHGVIEGDGKRHLQEVRCKHTQHETTLIQIMSAKESAS